MRVVILTVILRLGCCFSFLEAVPGGQPPPVFRAHVTLVHNDAEVIDANGRLLTGLSKADFRVFDNEAEQPLFAVAGEEQPLDIILLFDTSGSMRSAAAKVAAAGHNAFSMLRSGDRVAVMAFDTDAHLLTPLTKDLVTVEGAISLLSEDSFNGGTRIQDAVHDAGARFVWSSQNEQRRRAVLVITDNHGSPARSQQSIIEDFWESDTLLSALIIPKHKSPAALMTGREPGGVDRIVEQTGGDVVYAKRVTHTFPELLERIRLRYSLYYRLPKGEPGALHRVRVELSSEAQSRYPGARVVVRHEYRARTRDENGFKIR
jgi:VWFA-related protein